ncbi:hypothetical protein D3C76_230010 [compost metagenome]
MATSIFTLGRKSTTYSAPRYNSVWPFCRPKPLTSVTVMPCTPISDSDSRTSSSLNGLMMAVTSFMKLSPDLVDLPQENKPVSSLSAAVGFVTRRRHPAPRAHCLVTRNCISAWLVQVFAETLPVPLNHQKTVSCLKASALASRQHQKDARFRCATRRRLARKMCKAHPLLPSKQCFAACYTAGHFSDSVDSRTCSRPKPSSTP